MKDLQMVYIEWVDSVSDTNDWTTLDKAISWSKDDVTKIKSLGFEINRDKDYITVCGHYHKMDDEANVSGLMRIPLKAVTKIKVVKIK